jgi:hypothetical protein
MTDFPEAFPAQTLKNLKHFQADGWFALNHSSAYDAFGNKQHVQQMDWEAL